MFIDSPLSKQAEGGYREAGRGDFYALLLFLIVGGSIPLFSTTYKFSKIKTLWQQKQSD